jgi:hypothetical protein
MLPGLTLPPSLTTLLAAFQPLFTAPSFRTFGALAAGFLAQTGRRTVCGMLTGAGLSQVWRHRPGAPVLLPCPVERQGPRPGPGEADRGGTGAGGEPVLAAIDDTLFKRTGRKVHAIGWFHDGSVTGCAVPKLVS